MTPLETIQSQNIEEIQKLFKKQSFSVEQQTAIDQYKVSSHGVFDETLRPKREVKRDTGLKDTTGQPIMQTVQVEVVRVGIPWQKRIVNGRVGFMLTNPVTISAKYFKETDKEKALVAMVKEILDNNKMDYLNKEILRRKLSEMEVAVLWYFVETGEPKPKFTLRCKIVSPELGDTLYPLFDKYADLISLARGYKVNEDGKDIEHYDVYTPEFTYFYANRGGWKLDELEPINPVPNPAKKLLLEYYKQDAPVWHDEQTEIDRHETLTSNHGGMNDKFGAPIFAVVGAITSQVNDNQTGTLLQIENGGSAEYKQLSSEPQSIKLEQDNLEKFIYSMSQTANISFDKMMAIGQMSGFAATMLFSDSHMACAVEEETFGIGLQRRLNIIKAAIAAVIDTSLANEAKVVQLKPKFKFYTPLNTTELIDNIGVSVTSGIMSKQTGSELNPLITDPETEVKRLQEDATAALAGQ